MKPVKYIPTIQHPIGEIEFQDILIVHCCEKKNYTLPNCEIFCGYGTIGPNRPPSLTDSDKATQFQPGLEITLR